MKPGEDYIGVTVNFFCHDGKRNLLLYKRSNKSRDEHGRWDPGGGRLEFGEAWEDAIRREVKEEFCTEIKDIKYIATTNVLREHNGKPTHWIALIFAVEIERSQVKIGEPEKMDDIGWFSPDHLPTPYHSQMDKHLKIVRKAGIL